MKVKLITRMAGPDWHGAPGEVVEVPEAVGKMLVERGFAEELEPRRHGAITGEEHEENLETTDMPPGEKALNPAGKRRRK